jgi:hypothetical protein
MKMKIILGISVMFLFFAVLAGNASALDVTTDSCYTFADNNTYVTLNASLSVSGGQNCFQCSGYENITVDCAGYTVTGSGSQPRFFRNTGCNNVTIKNCTTVDIYYLLWTSGTDYPTRDYHIYNVNATKYTTDSSGAYLYVTGGDVINMDSYNITYYDDGSEHMYYLEGANRVNAYQYNVTQTGGGGGSRWRISGGTRTYYAEDYAWMNITTLNATSSDAIPTADVNITDSAGIHQVNSTTDAFGSLYDYLLFQYYNITASSGTGGSETSANPQSISGRKGTYVNSTTFDAVADGNFLLYLETPIPDVDAPNVTIKSPLNGRYYTPDIYFNVTMNDTHPDTCLVNWGQGNYTMTNSSGDWNYLNDSMPEGSYIVDFFCNDTSGNIGYNSTNFDVDLPPIILVYGCITMTEPNTAYMIQNDIYANLPPSEQNCFVGIAENITLDCDGYNIYYNGTSIGEPTVFRNNANNAVIQNCDKIIGFQHLFVTSLGGIVYISAMNINNFTGMANVGTSSPEDLFENVAGNPSKHYYLNYTNMTINLGMGIYGKRIFITDGGNITAYFKNVTYDADSLYSKYNTGVASNFTFYRMWNNGIIVRDADTDALISGADVGIVDAGGFVSIAGVTDAYGFFGANLAQFYINDYRTDGVNIGIGDTGNSLNPQSINVSKANYSSNMSEFNVTDNSIINVYLSIINIPIANQLPPIVFQLVITLGFGIMGLFAVLTLLGFGYIESTGKPDPETIAKIMIGITIIILMIVAVWTGIVTPP